MPIVFDLCGRGSIEKARRGPPRKRKEGEEKEKALIEWGIMRQTERQMLACLYKDNARSFTRIPVKGKCAREVLMATSFALRAPPAAAIVWIGKDRISMATHWLGLWHMWGMRLCHIDWDAVFPYGVVKLYWHQKCRCCFQRVSVLCSFIMPSISYSVSQTEGMGTQRLPRGT